MWPRPTECEDMQKYSLEHKKWVTITVCIEVIRKGSNGWGSTWSLIIIFVFGDFSSKLSLWNSVGNTWFILPGPDYGWTSLTFAQGAELKGAPNQFGTLRNVVSMFFLNHARKQCKQRGGVCLQFCGLLCHVDLWHLTHLLYISKYLLLRDYIL